MSHPENNNDYLVFVLYDSVHNSVFEGQVLEPLRKQKTHKKILLISFEKNKKRCPLFNEPGITVMYLSKYPFLGSISLWPAIIKLRSILRTLPAYTLIARGPLASFISFYAAQKTRCMHLTMQARGLLAEEYQYVHKKNSGIAHIMHRYRTYQYRHLEQKAYTLQSSSFPIKIEAVSKALADYLQTRYAIKYNRIHVAFHDIPSVITSHEKLLWRTTMREKLHIPDNAYVYCYNGSAKAWQCPDMVIDFFMKEYATNSSALLLVLTQDRLLFKSLLDRCNVPSTHYRLLTVHHAEIYQYLAACDAGLIFRESHILNWISRPTKILEYQAVGLPIIHNKTVAMLTEV